MKKSELEIDETNCPIRAAIEIIGGKWKPVILYYIKTETVCRFSQLQKLIPHITKKMLTQQLRELEADGIVNRRIYPQVPPKVEYTLTDYGATLKPVLALMADWGAAHRAKILSKAKKENFPSTHL